jgi:ABC-2 type transport system permease protein
VLAMAVVQPHDQELVISARPRWSGLFGDLWRYRELLVGLVRKELKVKYKDSALGFLWSMLNPALYLVVFWIVFAKFLGSGVPDFHIFLLSGLLVWNLFNGGVLGGTGSVVAGGSLVKKVYFPRVIMPLSAVGASLVHFFLQSVVLLLALAIFRYNVDWAYVPLLVPALLVLLLLTAGVATLCSAVNVYMRDTQHLVELGMLAWFWLTPIVYPYRSVTDKLISEGAPSGILLLNPLTPIVLTFQRALYANVGGSGQGGIGALGGSSGGTPGILPPDANQLWYLRNLGVVAIGAIVLLCIAWMTFRRLEGNFAEEL